MEGTQVSSYLLEEKIGVGGFGAVYAAKHVDLPDIKVAVKLMHAHHSSDVEYIKNLKQECMVLHKLQHPNIVGFREFVINNDPPAIIMEFLKGEDAEERAKHTPFSLEEITKIAIDSLQALDYAHKKKIIHRDIKPSNLFICTDGAIKVADFGIAKAFDSQNQTETGILKGTLNYMAPELFCSNPVTGAADFYALGLSLWELLVGNIACPSGSLMTKVNWHMNHLISDIR